jgi:hypothetical protein
MVRSVNAESVAARNIPQRLDLQEAIQSFLAVWNTDPKPFVWTAKLEDILEKISRARTKLESIKPGSTLPRRRQKREE